MISKFDFRRQIVKSDEAESVDRPVSQFIAPKNKLGAHSMLEADRTDD